MRDHLSIGSTPCDEDCAQVGRPDYYERSHEEGKRFIALIRAKFGPEPYGASLKLKGFPHDFGTYYEVVVTFDDENQEAADFAYFVEANTPQTWDDNAPTDWRAA